MRTRARAQRVITSIICMAAGVNINELKLPLKDSLSLGTLILVVETVATRSAAVNTLLKKGVNPLIVIFNNGYN